ncbi:hypothetical protein K438DRAFT_1284719 [Mycena galopus ATCC 62051]|nr:hypothetical protein K438DRAFT_1284719 [Mycena galopus ATCC 62051]
MSPTTVTAPPSESSSSSRLFSWFHGFVHGSSCAAADATGNHASWAGLAAARDSTRPCKPTPRDANQAGLPPSPNTPPHVPQTTHPARPRHPRPLRGSPYSADASHLFRPRAPPWITQPPISTASFIDHGSLYCAGMNTFVVQNGVRIQRCPTIYSSCSPAPQSLVQRVEYTARLAASQLCARFFRLGRPCTRSPRHALRASSDIRWGGYRCARRIHTRGLYVPPHPPLLHRRDRRARTKPTSTFPTRRVTHPAHVLRSRRKEWRCARKS